MAALLAELGLVLVFDPATGVWHITERYSAAIDPLWDPIAADDDKPEEGTISNPINDGGVDVTYDKGEDKTTYTPSGGNNRVETYQDNQGKWHVKGAKS
jgi:hypothetical protein